MKYYLVTFKHGLQNPIKLEAKDEEAAKKAGYVHHLKNSGFVEFVEQKLTVNDVIDTVTLIED